MLFWLLVAAPETGLNLIWPLSLAIVFAVLSASELRRWHQHGRPVVPVSTLPPSLSPELRSRVAALVRDGNGVGAVRLVRQETGAGLLAAKRAVDAAG